MDNQNQNQDKETATGTNLNANPSNTYVSPNVTNGLVNVNPIKPKGSKKKSLIITVFVTCIIIYIIIPLVLIMLFLSSDWSLFGFGPNYDKAQRMVEYNLSKNCSQSETYAGNSYGGGEQQSTGYGWIGLCDGEIMMAESSAEFLSSDYSYNQFKYNSVFSSEVESEFPNSPYFFKTYGDDIIYHDIDIILRGDTWNDIEKYRTKIISLVDSLKNIYKNDDISISVYLTPDESFNNNYYKAFLFNLNSSYSNYYFSSYENTLYSNINLLKSRGGGIVSFNIFIRDLDGRDTIGAFERALTYLKKEVDLNQHN